MDRNAFELTPKKRGTTSYEIYLNTFELLSCQKALDELANGDELQFQIVHQVQELWMKLIVYTLMEIDDQISSENTNLVLSLFARVHRILGLMISTLSILETMSPKRYQEIRVNLGNGSGRESPGFRQLVSIGRPLWQSFERFYLERRGLSLEMVYDASFDFSDSYMVAEAFCEFDELFQRFRFHHYQLVGRTIGLGSVSLKGRSVKILEQGLKQRFFPELWEIRNSMTDGWGERYGRERDGLNGPRENG